MLDNQDIWFELLQHSISDGPEWFSQLTEDELSFNQAVRVLCDHGLAQVDISSESGVESKGYSIHSCVHSWTIYFLNQKWDVGMAGLALECVGSHVPNSAARKAWVTQRRLIRHAVRCWYFVENGMISEDGIAWVLDSLGNLYSDLGKLGEAEKMYKRALQGREKALGPEHTSTLSTVNNLGNLYADQGKLGEAEKMFERALQGYEKALGHERVNTYIPALNAIENFAMLYVEIGRADKARDMYSRALYGLEAVLGRSSKRC
jgi:tetratricopeptide (TPR) repeat protein